MYPYVHERNPTELTQLLKGLQDVQNIVDPQVLVDPQVPDEPSGAPWFNGVQHDIHHPYMFHN